MRSRRIIKQDLSSLADFRGLIEVYEELAAMKVQAIRQAIVASRLYFAGLARLSDEIGADLQQLRQDKKGEAAVFVAANANLFGPLIDQVFGEFLAYVNAHPTSQIYIAGSVGVTLMQAYAPKHQYQLLDIPDEEIDAAILSKIVPVLLPFEQIKVFYGEFHNIVHQAVSQRSFSGTDLSSELPEFGSEQASRLAYLYEPSIDTISQKLGTEIFASVFEQTLREAQLAKFAARLMHLDGALSKVDQLNHRLAHEQVRVERRIQDKKQRARLVGLWRSM